MRRKNQKKGKQFEKKVKKLIFILIALYVGQGVVKGMFSEKTLTIYNTAQAEEAETIELPNPCALEVVECAGERMSTSSDVSLASGNKGQLSPQRLNADGTGAKTDNEEANISRMASASSIETLIRQAWAGTGEEEIALAIAKSESGLRADAKGDLPIQFYHEGKLMGHSCGIFQIRVLPGRPDCETLKDPKFNVEYARKLYDRSHFQPWSNYKNERYLQFLSK
jgi:hypothetical protein